MMTGQEIAAKMGVTWEPWAMTIWEMKKVVGIHQETGQIWGFFMLKWEDLEG